MSLKKMDGLSPEKALLMEIALELLGNTVFDVYGSKQHSLVDLFRENTIPKQAGPTNLPPSSTSSQKSLLRPFPQRLTRTETQSPRTAASASQDQQSWIPEDTDTDQSAQDTNQAARDKEFVDEMMNKIDKEYSNLLKSSRRQKHMFFKDFWTQHLNNSPNGGRADIPPELSQEYINTVAEKYYLEERRTLEDMWKEQKDSIMLMKHSATTVEEFDKVESITRKISLVKDKLEQSLLTPTKKS